jgi:PAS domain S-box-containing protein
MTRVLVVDDHDDNIYYLQALFGAQAYDVAVARHGAEALTLARQQPPDVIVSDLLMPVMDGYTLLRHWKADHRLRAAPFVVYTATYTEAEDERLALDLGADAFILKPAEPDEFLVRLHEVLARAQPARPKTEDEPDGFDSEPQLLKQYSETLIRKLEEKTLQLEDANAALQADIAERERVEAALRASEQEFRVLLESLPQMVWIADRDGEIVEFNDRWYEVTGISRGASTGSEWIEQLHPDDVAVAEDRWAEAVRTQTSFDIECRLRRADGSYLWMLGRAHPLRDESGAVVKWLGTGTDIDDLKRAEAQMLRAQRMESIGTLAGGIAHDLNNLLAPISIGAGLLQASELDDESRRVVELMAASAQRGAELIRRVLSFARGIEGVRSKVDLRAVLEAMHAIVTTTFPKRIEIAAHVPDDLWQIVGDPTQLDQVLLNLCVNARDAISERGRIVIEAENLAQARRRDHGEAVGPHVVISVADDGCGIPAELIDRVFEPFLTTKEPGQGSGLGLSTVAAIVTSHGGWVEVESRVGEGSRFEVFLPVGDLDRAERPTSERALGPEEGHGELILVIDDEEPIVAMIRHVLERNGYRVVTGGDGAAGLALFREHHDEIALVLTDATMPAMRSSALVPLIREIEPRVPVVTMSGLSPEVDHGSDDHHFLAKPFRPDELLVTIQAALAAR